MADSRYCDRADIEDRWGIDNPKKWADLDDDQDATKIAARIERAIEAASDEIDDELRGGPYLVPIRNDGQQIPRTIRRLAAQMAGIWLYENRGTEDYDAENDTIAHRLTYAKKESEQIIRRIKFGAKKIDAEKAGSARLAAVTSDEIDSGSWIRRGDQ